MREMIQARTGLRRDGKTQEGNEDHGYVWPVCGAGIGLIGGVLAPIAGAATTIFCWFDGAASTTPMLHKIATICFYLTVPLLIFGGCCLDALEKRGWKIG
jgi:hypothetical protein